MKMIPKRAIVLGVASVIALGTAAPGFAAPVPSSTSTLKNAVPTDVVEVRHRWRRSAFPAVVLGMFGAIAAAAAADAYRDRYYYGYPYPYAYGPYPYRYYHGPYSYGPTPMPGW